MIAAFVRRRRRRAPRRQRRLLDSYAFEATERYPNPVPTKAACGPWASRSASAGCPWAGRRRARRGGGHAGSLGRTTGGRTGWLTTARRSKGRRLAGGTGSGRQLGGRHGHDAEAGPRRLPRRPGRDRAQLRLHRDRRPHRASSTAGSCSPSPTCPASTWSCPTSPTCARTPDRVDGIVLTHGHEDHTGGLAYLLRDLAPRSTAPS